MIFLHPVFGPVLPLQSIIGTKNSVVVKDFYYLVTVAETVFVIPAKAGIQLFRSGPLLPASAGTSLHLRKQVQG